MTNGMGPMGKDMNDTLRVLHELTVGTPLTITARVFVLRSFGYI